HCSYHVPYPRPFRLTISWRPPLPHFPALQLAGPFRPRQLGFRPDRDPPKALVILQLRVGLAHNRFGVRARIDHQHAVNSFLAAVRGAYHCRIADSRQSVEHALDVLREDVEPFRCDDHFFLATLDEESALRIPLADVARVEPAIRVQSGSRLPTP